MNSRFLTKFLFSCAAAAWASSAADAALLTNTTYSANANYTDINGLVQSGTTVWTINPGVTVSVPLNTGIPQGGGRFFIGEQTAPNNADAVFEIAGGGSLVIANTNAFTMRLGQNNSVEAGILRISGGSIVEFTGNQGPWSEESNGVAYTPSDSRSRIELVGVGSTLIAEGTYNPTTGLYNRGTTASNALPVTTSGGVLSSSYNAATNVTTLTVLAAPPDPVLAIANPPLIQSDGSPVSLSIPFTNNGATLPLTISSVIPGGTDAGRFTVNSFTSPVAPGGSGTIELTFTPLTGGGNGGPYSANLTITSNDSVNSSQMLALTAAVADPALFIAAQIVDFGTLAANPGPSTATLTITNDGGTANLNVSAILLGNTPEFAITSIPGPIAPGASADIVISFTPGSLVGHFGSLLSITSDAAYNSSAILPVTAQVTPAAALPTPLAVANADFNENAYNSQNSTAPNGWTSSLVAIPGNYGQTIVNIATGFPALFWSRGGNYLQQNLSTSNSGLTADKLTAVEVTFDRGYRNDVVTKGDILMRLSLWDLTTDTEIAGRDVVIEDTGVKTGTERNLLSNTSIALPVTGAAANPVALRISTVQPVLATNQFEATALIDNISIAVSGSYNPSTPFQTWAIASGLDGTPGKEAGVIDDPDQDGATNFEEFAFGADPLSSSSTGLVGVVTADSDSDTQKELLITLAVRSGASFAGSPSPIATLDGVSYSIQGSVSLTAFDQTVEGPLGTVVLPPSLPPTAPTGYEYKTFRLAGSNGLPSRGFLRSVASEVP
jgi:hypothetical protein